MVNEFKRRLKELAPSYIVSTHTCSYGHLNMIACAYARNENYYLAVSYYTVSWIANNPVRPLPSDSSTDQGLSGIASIHRFSDLSQLEAACKALPREKDMAVLAEQVCQETQRRYSKVFKAIQGNDTVEWQYVAVPSPAIVATVRDGAGVLIGTIVVPVSGDPYIAMECSPRIRRTYLHYILSTTREAALYPMTLGLGGS